MEEALNKFTTAQGFSMSKLRDVNSKQIQTHKAAINPLINDLELMETVNQVTSILAFVQSITLIGDDKQQMLELQPDAVTGLYFTLQTCIKTLDYVSKCVCVHDIEETSVPMPKDN